MDEDVVADPSRNEVRIRDTTAQVQEDVIIEALGQQTSTGC